MRLSSEADVHKVVQYTLEDTAPESPNLVVHHSLTSDIKNIEPQICVNKLHNIVTKVIEAKWPGIPIISLATPRTDKFGRIVQILKKA